MLWGLGFKGLDFKGFGKLWGLVVWGVVNWSGVFRGLEVYMGLGSVQGF